MTSSRDKIIVDEILKDAEPRVKLSSAAENELYDALHTHWQASVVKRRRQRWYTGIAAVVLVSLLGVFVARIGDSPDLVPTVLVARVEAMFGPGSNTASDNANALSNSGNTITVDTVLFADTLVQTGRGERLALDLNGGGKLRLNQNTKVHLLGVQQLALVSGSVYFDSDDKAPALLSSLYEKNTVQIETPFGQLVNKGTQYLVELSAQALTVTVRSGVVELATDAQPLSIDKGSQLMIGADRTPRWKDVSTFGKSWDWVEQTLPGFDLNQAPLILLLEWVAHETGREIVFADEEARQLAQTSLLVGRVDLRPLDALRLWIETVDLEARVTDAQITIAVSR